MLLHPAARTSELKGELEICKRVLAVVRDVDSVAGDDAEVATEELRSHIRETVDEKHHAELDAEFFDKLDLSTVKDRWVLCMAVFKPHEPAPSVRSAILHEMYKPFVAYNVLVLHKYDGETMTELFRALKGELHIDDNPQEFMDVMLASLCEQWQGSNPEFLKQKMDEYVAEVVTLTVEKIDGLLEELAPLIGLDEMLRELTAGLLGRMGQTADELEEAGAPVSIVLAARQMEAEAAASATEPPGELAARGRIHEAVLRVMRSRGQVDIDRLVAEAPELLEVTQAWAMHPERLSVETPEGNIPLIEGVMGDPLVVEQIVSAICQGKVIYTERVKTPS